MSGSFVKDSLEGVTISSYVSSPEGMTYRAFTFSFAHEESLRRRDAKNAMEGHDLIIVGAGLAGCEAAWQAAIRGITVLLVEMKPVRFSPAHTSRDLAELVCSNSFRAESLENAVGLLKEEMRRMGTLFMKSAEAARIPAGGALAVDRGEFASFITHTLERHPRVTVVREEVGELPHHRPLIIATGPLTSDSLSSTLGSLVGEEYFYFYDAISPVVEADSINMSRAFRASRYNRGGDDYLNCPLQEQEYYRLVEEITHAAKVPLREFERSMFFEGCLPVEEMAARGARTLAFGPMKPVGLRDPRTGNQPFAVVQLRLENKEGTLYNMVGFQTRLTWPEQKRVFRLIPGLEEANFVRFGSCHRNTFINAPRLLLPTLQLRAEPDIFLAGQISGVEGYVESAAMGMIAGINASRLIQKRAPVTPPATTAIGALLNHLTGGDGTDFQPMHINYGLFPPLDSPGKAKKRRSLYAQRALLDLERWKEELPEA